jgi:hypothetical protein
VSLVLRLNRQIDSSLRGRYLVGRRRLVLPQLWASFPSAIAGEMAGSGPELDALCKRFGLEQDAMFRKFPRKIDNQIAYPMDWVSEHMSLATKSYVDVGQFRQGQTFGVADPKTDLVGCRGASCYDFYSNHCRETSPPVSEPRAEEKTSISAGAAAAA